MAYSHLAGADRLERLDPVSRVLVDKHLAAESPVALRFAPWQRQAALEIDRQRG